ncbi:hypothetical protein ABNB59_10510 [Paenibacillus larvae]|uniref:Uncharacterized protein n=1 Tax=Paenibacillus larvae TaxID=1464 RepID=A0AAP5N0R0_9BACL|nr:hypothetical protein [Paenibacillus larvae]MCY7475942.1 hypothetical protein [Paenibacillus larvae]MCY7488870.1 hypothetical protein [Paenibacillus larvae]MCY9562214.1 hypothetical protein [Paenibacillus larvae]MCY9569382.1 hypothetical protein [Paenibacillus larvae]MCY9573704.1 hypothetical protein [Paenibacillus larvae]
MAKAVYRVEKRSSMIKGCIVIVDALNTQKEIARKIVKENKADYVFA